MIKFVPETGSTSTDLLDRLKVGDSLAEGDWLVADRQTDGRGRQGRDWFDAVGNFMGSTVVNLRAGDPSPETLALVAGLALFETVSWHLPRKAELLLKWPNDLMAGDAKVAGILLESTGNSIVVGIGVNLVSAPDIPGRKTAALSDLGTAPDRNLFASDLERSFATELERWRQSGLAQVVRRWSKLGHKEGTVLEVRLPGATPISGVFAGLTDEGALQLRLADSSMRVIQAGEVYFAEDAVNPRM